MAVASSAPARAGSSSGVVGRARVWALFGVSVLAVYVLQGASPVRYLDFWLPTLSLALTALVWLVVQRAPLGKTPAPSAESLSRENVGVAGLLVAVAVGLSALRYTPVCCVTQTRPPDVISVLVGVGVVVVVGFVCARLAQTRRYAALAWALIGLLIALMAMLKADVLAQGASAFLRTANAQDPTQALPTDLAWLGFSYIAFRLIHVLRDAQGGRRAPMTLREFVTYVVFAPALLAGPIDRAERFVKELRAPLPLDSTGVGEAARRIIVGAFKKFVLADALALVALNNLNAAQTESPLWTWVMVYAFALRLLFDFSGYTDIAIGIGRLCGIKLPENFNRPYAQPNITLFWNTWHMTLTQWFRAYWFNPLTRSLRSRERLSQSAIVFVGQTSTMLLIALWHGVAPNFVIWGLWNAAGLFVHSRYAEWAKARSTAAQPSPARARILKWGSVFLTFNFVALGWVWFALADVQLALRVFATMLGLGG